ncbi:MAG TPA: hypothetical protein VJJ52_06430 [Candidatus Nanoarchaeia archaeon]|nr:hypothetical protein [Candidatus Nanoarchaeia archaeon]
MKKDKGTQKNSDNNPPILDIPKKWWQKVLGWLWVGIKYLFPFVLGFLAGFLLTDKVLYLEHAGYFHEVLGHQFTTFQYIDFNDITRTYPLNLTTTDQQLTIHNKWIDEVWAKTEIKYSGQKSGLKIECSIDNSNESCTKYRLPPRQSVKLKFIISSGILKTNNYKNVCFITTDKSNEDNYIEECLDFNINIYR